MPICTVTLSANSGVAIDMGGVRLWYDALHQDEESGFSPVRPALLREMESSGYFADPNIIMFSHCHPDHYSRELVSAAARRYPKAALILPEREFEGQILLEGRDMRLSLFGLELHFRRLTHEGERFAQIPHYGCIISYGSFRMLLGGDGAICSGELEEFVRGEEIDLALLDFPWAALGRGREFLESVIRPKSLLLAHLPFEEDDKYGYRRSTERSARFLSGIEDVRIMLRPMQREEF